MKQAEKEPIEKNAYLKTVEKMLKELQYGSVTITVQDGRVVQIEKLEKHRIKD